MDLHLCEHAAAHVGIGVGDPLRVGEIRRLDDDEATCAVGERARELHAAGTMKDLEVGEMRRPKLRSQVFCFRAVVADNDEEQATFPAEPVLSGLGIEAYPSMAEDERQWPLERFVLGIDELKVVLGADVAPQVERVKEHLVRALAHRDRGDRAASLESMASAMAELAALGDSLDAAEGAMMRAVAAAFVGGLARDDRDVVERNLGIIQSRAGKPKKPEGA